MLNLETRGEISSHSLLKVIKVDPTILFFNMNSLWCPETGTQYSFALIRYTCMTQN